MSVQRTRSVRCLQSSLQAYCANNSRYNGIFVITENICVCRVSLKYALVARAVPGGQLHPCRMHWGDAQNFAPLLHSPLLHTPPWSKTQHLGVIFDAQQLSKPIQASLIRG